MDLLTEFILNHFPFQERLFYKVLQGLLAQVVEQSPDMHEVRLHHAQTAPKQIAYNGDQRDDNTQIYARFGTI
jgi:hypothetical protein